MHYSLPALPTIGSDVTAIKLVLSLAFRGIRALILVTSKRKTK